MLRGVPHRCVGPGAVPIELCGEDAVEPLPLTVHEGAVHRHGAAAAVLAGRHEVRIGQRTVLTGEPKAAAYFVLVLGGQTFSEQDVVRIQLDVPVGHLRRRLADDGVAVDQAHDRHQHATLAVGIGADEHRMAVREAQIAPGGRGRRRPRDPDGLLVVGQRLTLGIEGAVADPGDRTQQAGGDDGQIADAKVLDRYLAPRCGSGCQS